MENVQNIQHEAGHENEFHIRKYTKNHFDLENSKCWYNTSTGGIEIELQRRKPDKRDTEHGLTVDRLSSSNGEHEINHLTHDGPSPSNEEHDLNPLTGDRSSQTDAEHEPNPLTNDNPSSPIEIDI